MYAFTELSGKPKTIAAELKNTLAVAILLVFLFPIILPWLIINTFSSTCYRAGKKTWMTANPAPTIFRDNKWTHHMLLMKGLQIVKEFIKTQRGNKKARNKTVKNMREGEKCTMEYTILYTVVCIYIHSCIL